MIAGGLVAVLIAFASGYGYHRDELYFLVAGQHLAWAYPDQGALTPLIARLMSDVDAGSLVALRIPSALAAGATVLITGLIARELGGSARARTIAAICAAVSTLVLFSGHLLSTSTFDLLDWTAVCWLVVRAVVRRDDRLLLVAGALLGVGLMNKPLPAFLAVGLLAGVAISGPRRLLRSRYAWGGAAIALAIWSPWIIWQAAHGWPQIDVSRSIAAGNSTSSQPWWAVVPFQILVVSPPLTPVWVAGLVTLFRNQALRDLRFLAWAWVVLAVVFMASQGKPYYLSGLMPVLLAAGAIQVDVWLERGRRRLRQGILVAAIAASGAVDAVISLPIVPVRDSSGVVAMNPDVGETIGWPTLVRTVARVAGSLPGSPGRAVIVAENYGEAGAIDRYGGALGLPGAYSGHNAFAEWGPPPGSQGPVVAVGIGSRAVHARLRGCRLAARITNGEGVDNDERGEPVFACAGPRRTWAEDWPAFTHLG